MSHTCTHFQSTELLQIVDGTWWKLSGYHPEPFFLINVSNVVLDELHVILWITDRLEEGLIYDITKLPVCSILCQTEKSHTLRFETRK